MTIYAGEYLFPPRPEQAIPDQFLDVPIYRGWLGQAKMNGTCNVIFVSPGKKVTTMNRHEEAHKAWQPIAGEMAQFEGLPGKGWYVFVAELLYSKTKHIKRVNYINEALVWDGVYLVGTTVAERQTMLGDHFAPRISDETLTHFVIDRHTWLARNHKGDFRKLYKTMTKAEEVEGLVLKKADARLDLCSREKSNTKWLVKARKRHENYSF